MQNLVQQSVPITPCHNTVCVCGPGCMFVTTHFLFVMLHKSMPHCCLTPCQLHCVHAPYHVHTAVAQLHKKQYVFVSVLALIDNHFNMQSVNQSHFIYIAPLKQIKCNTSTRLKKRIQRLMHTKTTKKKKLT